MSTLSMSTLCTLLCASTLNLSPLPSTSNQGTPADTVKALYDAFPFGDTSVVTADRSELSRYLDSELIALLDADLECSRRTSEVCNLNGDPLYNAQDAQIEDLQVNNAEPGIVRVSFKNFGSAQQVVHRLRQTPDGWRVHDIEYGPGESLRGWLSTPIP
jgi:hypothetical protein